MSLLRLLTAGKCLVGGRDAESRYRLSSQRLLPQFGSARNPFTSRAQPEPASAEARPAEDRRETGGPFAPPAISVSKAEPAAALPRGAEPHAVLAKFDLRKLAEALWQRIAAVLSGWQARLGGLLGRSSGLAVKPAIPRFPKPPVQGELSLDRIKVVRNDLSDADLEVIPAKPPAAAAATAPVPSAAEEAEGAKRAWGRVTTRFMGAGKA